MESFNNSNNYNIELVQQKKQQQFQKIKKILKAALKKFSSSKKIAEEINRCEEENDFNEMLERRMEAQQNLINEQIVGKQEEETIGYCFVENEHGKFYWSVDINRFVAVDRDLIASQFCSTSHQQAQVQCY
jgi:predicted Holliday junction resolvase-like endonuclease